MSRTTKRESVFIEGDTAEVLGSPEATILKPNVPEIMVETSTKKTPKIEDMFKKVGKISIKPYVNPQQENMGLEDYGFALFPGTYHEEQIAALEKNGVIRYITGLDEFAPEVQRLESETREAVIKNIRMVVSFLEKQLASNVIKIDDEAFWDKVQLLKPNNHLFWSKITIRCGNEPVFFDPLEDAYDLIKFMAIEAGGFDLIAKSYDDAITKIKPPKFFLDKETFTVSSRTTFKKLKNEAIGELDSLYKKNPKKLLYVTKVIDGTGSRYTVSTPLDVLYDLMDEYIAGNGSEASPAKAAERFIEIVRLDMETLKLRALVKDASFYRIISLKADGMLYYNPTSTMLGRNVSDVVQYLKNPLNEDVLIRLLKDIEEEYWNK
jgi:hypothetical protein